MLRVFHIEDDSDIQEITKLALEFTGEFEVTQASSGDEALSRMDAAQIDVLLIDVMMPGMSGETLLSKIRELPQFKNTPAIFMTARSHASEVQELREAGVLDVITKPFDPMALGGQIKSILDKAA